MNIYKKTALSCLCVLFFAGCNSASIKEEKVAAELAPMENPGYSTNYVRTLKIDGDPITSTLVEEKDGLLHWERSDGCKYSVAELFAPGSSWQGCSATDGQQTFTANGSPWPLAVGKRWSYAIEGRNVKGDEWVNERVCEVESTARISAAAGDFDTYKVVCDDKYSHNTFYVSPVLKDFVKRSWWRKSRGQTIDFEMVKTS